MAHLSCVGETIDGLEAILDRLADAGIENVLALRGDPPRGETDFIAPEGGLDCSADLAAFIAARRQWGIGGSSFPEVHPQAASREADIEFLKRKVDSGARLSDHPAVLRQRRLLRLARRRPRRRDRRAGDRRDPAGDQLRRPEALLPGLRGEHPREPRPRPRRLRRRYAGRIRARASPMQRASARSCSARGSPESTSTR